MGKASRRKLHPAADGTRVENSRPSRNRRGLSGIMGSWVPYVLVLVTGVVLYANSFSIPFLFDDHIGIVGNDEIKEFESPFAYLTRSRGVTDVTLALNHRFGGLDVWAYHLVNVSIHIANGWLVYALALALLRLPFFAGRYRRRERDLATLVALVFIAHPLQTMAASYLIQRAESLAAMFYLTTVLLFTRASTLEEGGRRRLLYVAILGTSFLGILSKETAATVPFALLLYHVCFGARSELASAKRHLVGLLLLLAPILYAIYLARDQLLPAGGSDGLTPRPWFFIPSAGFNVEGVNAWTYLLTEFGVVVWYLRLYFLPTAQCFDYAWPFVDTFRRLDVIGPFLILLSIAALGVLSYRRYRLATFCIGWFFLCLAPSSSIIPLRDAAFEQRMYLPIFGLTLLVIVAGYDASRWLAVRWRVSRRHVAAALGTIAALWIAALGGLTVIRNHVYQDPMRLAYDSILKSRHNWRAHYEYGDELARRNRIDEAILALTVSMRQAPEKGTARIRLGGIYIQQGRLDVAKQVLVPATKVLEKSVAGAAHRQLAYVYLAKGKRGPAAAELRQAVALMPGWASVHFELGRLYAEQGMWVRAARRLNDAARLDPKLAGRIGRRAAEANYRAGVFFFKKGEMDEAGDMFRHAATYQPDFAAARHYLAASYAARGQWDEAREELAELSRLSPKDSLLEENRSRVEEKRQLLEPTG